MTISIKRADFYKYFFLLFLFLLPLQTRKVFLTEFSFYTGSFTEYGTVFLYLTDILFLLAFLSLVLFNPALLKNGFNKAKAKSGNSGRRGFFTAFLTLVSLAFLSSFFVSAYPIISLYRSCKLLEMLLLVFFIFSTFQDRSFLILSLFSLVFGAFFQAVIAIYQFLCQKSIFISSLFHKLTGETILSPDLPGVAKIEIPGEKLIRAYGTFPHPNVLGAFLVFSLLFSLYLYLHHYEGILSRLALPSKLSAIFWHKRFRLLFWTLLLTVQMIALLFSFSRSAWLGAALATIFLYLARPYRSRFVSRETIFPLRLAPHRELGIAALILLVIIVSNFQLIFRRFTQDLSGPSISSEISTLPHNDALSDRRFFEIVSRETISQHPLLGTGPGTAVFQIDAYLDRKVNDLSLAAWQYQPPHNIYMLSTAEVGIPGFLAFIFLVLYAIRLAYLHIVSRETNLSSNPLALVSLATLLAFLFIGCLDHHFWTMQQSQLIFWILIGMLIL